MSDGEESFISHLEALRGALLRCVIVTAALFPVGYALAPRVISALTAWCFPDGAALHYFAPMEVFFVQLRLALVIALVLAYPWNAAQIWRFVLPALYKDERRPLSRAVLASTLLFACGAAFCAGLVLPAVMKFSGGFAHDALEASIGIANFAGLAGWLTLAFGLMFQTPVIALLTVRFGVVSAESLGRKRPYVMTLILVAAGILTPPDVISQLVMAVPTWLLFELGLFAARRIERKNAESAAIAEERPARAARA